jgi:hypothetical protein
MESNLLEHSVADVLRETLVAAPGAVYVVNPPKETLEELIGVMGGLDAEVHLLADEPVLKGVMDDFIVASATADLIEANELDIRLYDGSDNTLLITEETVVAVVSAGDRVAGLVTDDTEFIERAYQRYAEIWDESEAFGLRTPAISRVRTSLETDIGPETSEDFDAVLSSLETARGDGDGLDEVTISLLVAAKNEELLYDISKWGEDVGIASKATFSRTKTKLEDIGLIATEKVPIDVGRPRLRLMLGDDRLREADADELANVAQSLLANHAS